MKDCPCPSASFSQIRGKLPSKGVFRQVGDGVSSYIDGVAWGGTALAARAGLLGDGMRQEAIDTNAQLRTALGQMASHPGQTAAAVAAVASKYPVQALSRLGSGAAVSVRFGLRHMLVFRYLALPCMVPRLRQLISTRIP